MRQFTECKLGHCSNQMLVANPNNPKTYRHVCDECVAFYEPYIGTLSEAPAARLYSAAKKMVERAKRRGKHEVTITFEDILRIWPKDNRCPIMGTMLVRGERGGRRASPSLDRIDSSKGYTPENIQVISTLANRLLSDATEEELVTFANYINRKNKVQ